MVGMSMENLYKIVMEGYEVEFQYKDAPCVLQSEEEGGKTYLVIYDNSNGGECICKQSVSTTGEIPKVGIDSILNEKCFGGRSFMEIEADVVVKSIV